MKINLPSGFLFQMSNKTAIVCIIQTTTTTNNNNNNNIRVVDGNYRVGNKQTQNRLQGSKTIDSALTARSERI